MKAQPLLIIGVLLLGAVALDAQAPQPTPATTPATTPDRPAAPSAPTAPASGDVHETPPPMEAKAPPVTPPPNDDKTDSKPQPGDKPK